MEASTKRTTVVTLTLTEREGLLLRSLFNGLQIHEDGEVRARAAEVASSLSKAETLTPSEVAELQVFCGDLHSAIYDALKDGES